MWEHSGALNWQRASTYRAYVDGREAIACRNEVSELA